MELMEFEWSWSGVMENPCGSGVEVEEEISNLGTLAYTVNLKFKMKFS